jgi:hypothetical protein
MQVIYGVGCIFLWCRLYASGEGCMPLVQAVFYVCCRLYILPLVQAVSYHWFRLYSVLPLLQNIYYLWCGLYTSDAGYILSLV